MKTQNGPHLRRRRLRRLAVGVIAAGLILLPASLWAQGGGGGGGSGGGSSAGGGSSRGGGGGTTGRSGSGQIGGSSSPGTGGTGSRVEGGNDTSGRVQQGIGDAGSTLNQDRGLRQDRGIGLPSDTIPRPGQGASGNVSPRSAPGQNGGPATGRRGDLGIGPDLGSSGGQGTGDAGGQGAADTTGGQQGLGGTGGVPGRGGDGRQGFQSAPDFATTDPQRPALGIRVGRDPQGRVLVSDVRPEGPAAQAGLQVGDEIVAIGSLSIRSPDDVVKAVQSDQIGDSFAIQYRRDGQLLDTQGQLGSYTAMYGRSDLARGLDRPALGIRVRTNANGRLEITEVEPNTPATAAGLRVGDEIVSIADTPTRDFTDLANLLDRAGVGNQINLRIQRNGQELSTITRVGSYTAIFASAPTGPTERQVLRRPLEEPAAGQPSTSNQPPASVPPAGQPGAKAPEGDPKAKTAR